MKLELSYQTQELPAPFAYAAFFSIDLGSDSDAVHVDFKLTYLDREDLSEDEIIAEGYTLNDDVSWQGEIGEKWITPLNQVIKYDYTDEPKAFDYLHVKVDDTALGYPNQIAEGVILVQELMQAAFEGGKIERTLLIEIMSDAQTRDTIEWIFLTRVIKVNGIESTHWNVGQDLLRFIYQTDFEFAKTVKTPQSNCVNIGEDMWYVMDVPHVWEQIKSAISNLKG